MKSHTCKESTTCICSVHMLAPDEDCPIHGSGPYPPRCEICGRFVSHTPKLKKMIKFLENYLHRPTLIKKLLLRMF